jgi:hypothetical protein
MCFQITGKRKVIDQAKKKRVVWKRVDIDRHGYAKSPTVAARRKVWYGPGEVDYGGGPTHDHNNEAVGGIYVYLDKREAMFWDPDADYVSKCGYVASWRSDVGGKAAIRCLVDPDDLLHVNRRGTVATYKKVTVPEEQPFVEWY